MIKTHFDAELSDSCGSLQPALSVHEQNNAASFLPSSSQSRRSGRLRSRIPTAALTVLVALLPGGQAGVTVTAAGSLAALQEPWSWRGGGGQWGECTPSANSEKS